MKFRILLIFVFWLISVNAFADLNSDLFKAVDDNDTQRVSDLLKQGADSNAITEDGTPIIYLAIKKDSIPIVKLLIDNDASLDSPILFDREALDAFDDEHNYDSDNIPDYVTMSPLDFAIFVNDINMVKLLLSNGSQVNGNYLYHGGVLGDFFNTPIMEAINSGNYEVLELLLERGVDATIGDQFGNSPYTEAVDRGNYNIIKTLGVFNYGETIYDDDCRGDDRGINGLYEASFISSLINDNKSDLFSLFLDNNLNFNAKTCDGGVPLIESILDNLDIVKLFVAHGANLNITANNGVTPLMLSMNVKVAKYLIDHGANINATNNLGGTVLISSVYNNNIDMVKLLLSKGADTSIKDKAGKNALDYAKEKKFNDIISLLENNQPLSPKKQSNIFNFTFKTIEDLIIKNDYQTLKDFLNSGNNKNYHDSNGFSILMYSIITHNNKLFDMVINSDLNFQDDHGMTALMYGADVDNIYAVKVLLKKGAKQNMQNKEGETALMIAKNHKMSEMITLLSK